MKKFDKDKALKDEIKIKEGDRFNSPEFGELEYGGHGTKTLYGRKYVHKFFIVGPDGKRTTRFYSWENLSDAMGRINQKKGEVKVFSGDHWMPTKYAESSDVEWFAEIFSYGVTENVKEVLDWIKDLK